MTFPCAVPAKIRHLNDYCPCRFSSLPRGEALQLLFSGVIHRESIVHLENAGCIPIFHPSNRNRELHCPWVNKPMPRQPRKFIFKPWPLNKSRPFLAIKFHCFTCFQATSAHRSKWCGLTVAGRGQFIYIEIGLHTTNQAQLHILDSLCYIK